LGYTLLYIVGLSGIGNILAKSIVAVEDFKLLTVLSHWPVSAGPFVISLFLFVKIDLATDSCPEYDRDKKK